MKRTIASWRYAHLQYPQAVDDEVCNAAGRAALDCRIQKRSTTKPRFFSFGVVQAFCDMREVAPQVHLPFAAAVVWSHVEFVTIAELLEEMRP